MRPKSVRAVSLNAEEEQDRQNFLQQGLKRLGLPDTEPPKTIVKALRVYLDDHRQTMTEEDEEAYADFILSLAYVFGEQLCKAYGWQWQRLEFGGEPGGINVVEVEGRCYINPTGLIKDIVDDPHRSNNTALIFSMTAPDTLNSQSRELQPGRYMGLH